MTESARLPLYEELVRRLASALRSAQLYAPGHPLITKNLDSFVAAVAQLHGSSPSVAIGVVGRELVVSDTPLVKASAGLGDLTKRLQGAGIERITIDRGVTVEETRRLLDALAGAAARPDASTPAGFPALAHIRVGRIRSGERSDTISGDIASIRRLYTQVVQGAEAVWQSAMSEGTPDLAVARAAIDDLAEAVAQNRTAAVALTAMKAYDNYTFTHMVNVSILTMGQGRALGIEGRLLREFGLAGLMHDIGKVRTPPEILNKPEKLTDAEFDLMKRHVVDGAEILRATTEMPVLAPVVAFEHHLRLDGAGYPESVTRTGLNLGTMLCGIADVYDAMRSQRTYQQSFPTDRILAVLKRNDGQQFDQNLVRRFVQLIGIYPAGNLVRLSTGEIAVVVQVHAPDPYRPAVKVLFDAEGAPVDPPRSRNLWEAGEDPIAPSIICPLDPADVGIDPLSVL